MRLSVIVIVCLAVATARAQDYFPLAEGATWMYESVDGESTNLVVIDGTAPVIDGLAVVRHEVIAGGGAQEVFNFWTRDAEGRLLLHGAYNPGGFLAYYDPPIVWIGTPPLGVGDTWCTEFSWYNGLDDPTPSGPHTLCYTVTTAETITVPAGTFATFGVEDALPARGGYNVLGERVGAEIRTPSVWYADGVGEVRSMLGDIVFELHGYEPGVGTAATTWGAVKALFE